MKRRIGPVMRTVVIALCAVCTTLTTRQLRAQDFAAPPPKMELSDGDCLVFLGDSITHQRLYTQYVEDYLYTRMPKLRLKIHNAGVGGARAWDALQRFDEDVASYKPKYVTILLGMNDGTYQAYNEEVFQTYRSDMTELLDKLQAIGAQAIPMTPTMFDSRAARMRDNPNRPRPESMLEQYNSVLAYYGSWLREQSLARGLGFVDMYSPLNSLTFQERKKDATFTLIQDAIHPGAAGQVIMATALVWDTGLPRAVSNIQISQNAAGKPSVRAAGGVVEELSFSESGLSFSWTAESLPWVLPEDAAQGVKLTNLGHRLSREALEVHGLPGGRYDLLIDGKTVGTYTADQLGRHIELQANDKTPQYQQAAEVAALNAKRNQEPISALRGQWSQFQRYARAKRAAEAAPENTELQKQLAATEQAIDGMQERVAQYEAEAKKIEDEIFAINQPIKRVFELRRK
ncbi:MAG: SGNH/GDSL hydrolase family protein [Planctomycetales bacterium]|nr:SGNH/GDSL hydrolase family protein [Planctomycetales bacterium]